MQLREEIRQRVATDDDMIYDIAKALNLKWRTVFLWTQGRGDIEKLTLAASLRVIKRYTGLTDDEILDYQDEKVTA
jgi:hypothetical protein